MATGQEWRDYYSRFWRTFRTNVGQQIRVNMIGLLLAVAILIAQLHHGVIPQAMTGAAALSVFWPYAALTGLILLWATVKTAVDLDSARCTEVKQAKQQIRETGAQIEHLEQELASVRSLSPADRMKFQHCKDALKHFNAQGKTVLRKVLSADGLDERHIDLHVQELGPRPQVEVILGEAQLCGLVLAPTEAGTRIYRIKPDLESALAAALDEEG